MKNDSMQKFNFSQSQITEIELILVKSLELFYELQSPCKIKDYVQDYIVKFCYERKLPIKETIGKVNELIKPDIHIKTTDVIPESKRGQAHLVNKTLLVMLNKPEIIFDESKTDDIVNNFTDLTGISKDLITPIVNDFRKFKKRYIIENDVYGVLNGSIKEMPDEKRKKQAVEMVINAYSEKLKVSPKYIKYVLKNKKEQTERKRKAEHEQKRENSCK